MAKSFVRCFSDQRSSYKGVTIDVSDWIKSRFNSRQRYGGYFRSADDREGQARRAEPTFVEEVEPSLDGDQLSVKLANDSIRARSYGALIEPGSECGDRVGEGFTRVWISWSWLSGCHQGKSLNLQLGHSHDINFSIPDAITSNASQTGFNY